MSVESEMPQRLLNSAVAFYQAGVRCRATWEISPGDTIGVGAPTVVNFAFSVELFLKLALLLTTGDIPKLHKLLDLYEGLNDSTKQLLQKHSPFPGDEQWFAEEIGVVSNAFVEWRYAHEKEFLSVSVDTIREIALCLHRAVREIAPELVSVYERR